MGVNKVQAASLVSFASATLGVAPLALLTPVTWVCVVWVLKHYSMLVALLASATPDVAPLTPVTWTLCGY